MVTQIECPHCKQESVQKIIGSINIDKNPEMRAKVQDLSCFRWECPNCKTTSLVMQPCLYHDHANEFMVWLREEQPERADLGSLEGYTLRWTVDFNSFREKINILERGLDDRVIEMMKYLLFAQINCDIDVVELLFHELDEKTASIRFVAVLSDGAEQYIAMPTHTYQRLAQDVNERLFTSFRDFLKIDLEWAREAFSLIHSIEAGE